MTTSMFKKDQTLEHAEVFEYENNDHKKWGPNHLLCSRNISNF